MWWKRTGRNDAVVAVVVHVWWRPQFLSSEPQFERVCVPTYEEEHGLYLLGTTFYGMTWRFLFAHRLAFFLSHHLMTPKRMPTMMQRPLLALCLVVATLHSTLAFTNVSPTLPSYTHVSKELTQFIRKSVAFSHIDTARSASNNNNSLPSIDDSNYKQVLFADSYEKAVLIDACAVYCGPCKLIEPILETCATKWHSFLDIYKFNVDANNNNNSNLKFELLMQNSMPRSLPSLVLIRNGKVVAKHSGIISEHDLDAWLDNHNAVVEGGGVASKTSLSSSKSKVGAGFVSMIRVDGADDYMLSGAIY